MAGMIEGLYEGDLKLGVREGQGTLTWSNGDKYVGAFKNGLRHGHGILYQLNFKSQLPGSMEQAFYLMTRMIHVTNQPTYHVTGEYYDVKGGTYTGNWSLSMKNGEGEMKWNNGDVYTGSFQQDKMHGEGTMVCYVRLSIFSFHSFIMCTHTI